MLFLKCQFYTQLTLSLHNLLKTHICAITYPNRLSMYVHIMLLFYLFWFPIFYYLFIYYYYYYFWFFLEYANYQSTATSCKTSKYWQWYFKKNAKNFVIQLATFGISNKNPHYSNPSSSIVTIEFIIIRKLFYKITK